LGVQGWADHLVCCRLQAWSPIVKLKELFRPLDTDSFILHQRCFWHRFVTRNPRISLPKPACCLLIAALKWYGSIQNTRGVLIGEIWNLATHDIEGFFDIEAFKIEGFYDIEEK
jgi:hypothetical protein